MEQSAIEEVTSAQKKKKTRNFSSFMNGTAQFITVLMRAPHLTMHIELDKPTQYPRTEFQHSY